MNLLYPFLYIQAPSFLTCSNQFYLLNQIRGFNKTNINAMKKTFHAKVPYAIFHNHEVPKIVSGGSLSGFVSAVLSEPQPSYSAIAKQVLATLFLKSRPPPMPILLAF